MRKALALAVLLVGHAALAAPSARTEFDTGTDAFKNHDCTHAMPSLTYVLYPDEKLADRDDLFIAHAMLGACEIESQNADEAKTEFRRALELVPDKDLDPLFFSATAVHTFDEVKADLVAQAKRDAEIREAQRKKEELARQIANLRVYEQNSLLLVFLPLGFGQFQNNSYLKGSLVAGGEVVSAGVSVYAWYTLVSRYGLSSNHVPIEDAKNVRTLQTIEVVSAIGFFGIYAYSMVDAYFHFHKKRIVPGSEELLRDLDDSARPDKPLTKKPPEKPKTSLHWGPIVVPNGAGVGLSWETP